MRMLVLFSLLLFSITTHAAEEIARFQAFTKEIRCVVCQNQSIADSNAPLAKDLREKIHQLMLDNKTDAEIKDYLVKRYGEYILLQPRFNKATAILWGFPFIGLLVILFAFFWISKKQIHPRS